MMIMIIRVAAVMMIVMVVFMVMVLMVVMIMLTIIAMRDGEEGSHDKDHDRAGMGYRMGQDRTRDAMRHFAFDITCRSRAVPEGTLPLFVPRLSTNSRMPPISD